MDFIKKFFKIDERKTSIKTEVIAGITVFLSMVYILPVNAGMLSEIGMPFGGVFLATALAAIVATLIMGLFANFPISLAPGMGINAFFTYSLVMFGALTWQQGLSVTLVSGILFIIISISGLRKTIINAIPLSMKYAIGAGIGFFIAFIGFQNAGIIVGNDATLVALGDLSNPGTMLTLFGLALALVLYVKGFKFSLIVAMVGTVIVGLIAGLIWPESVDSITGLPEFGSNPSGLGTIDQIFGQAFKHIGDVVTSKEGIIAIITLLFIDFFDTAGVLSAVGVSAGLLDEKGELVDADKALFADSVGTVAGAVLGTTTTTSYIESQVGIEQGARTGLTSVVVAILFGFALLAYPLISVFNGFVTAIPLIMVGAFMISQLKNIDWDDKEISISAFFTIIFMVLTYSIAEGIAFGFITYALLMAVGNRRKECSYLMYGLGVFFFLYYVFESLHSNGIF